MQWLGKKWDDIVQELLEKRIVFAYEISYPPENITPSGELRVVRIKDVDGKLKFTLLHDKFIR